MGPKTCETRTQEDLFRLRLENLIDLRHPLVVLSKNIDWGLFEREWGALFASERGRPALPTRLIAGLHYLKYAEGLSDDAVVAHWVENPYWQYFCGEEYFQHDLPCDSSALTRWRQWIGEVGVERLLKETIEAGKRLNVISQPRSCGGRHDGAGKSGSLSDRFEAVEPSAGARRSGGAGG